MHSEEIQRVLNCTNSRNILNRGTSAYVGEVLVRDHASLISGKGIIELGSAFTGVLPALFTLDIPSYTGADPFYAYQTKKAIAEFLREHPEKEGKFSAVNEDGLTFLQKQPAESATVISVGVLDDLVIGGYFVVYGALMESTIHHELRTVVTSYELELSREVYRVTPREGISYHWGIDNTWIRALQEAGFQPEEGEFPKCFFKK